MTKRAYDNSTRERKRLETRDKIVETMIELIAGGEEDVSVAELALRSGVAKRTVYQHFPDKAARVQAISDWVEARVDVGLVLPTGFDDIAHYIERRIDYILKFEQLMQVMHASKGLLKAVRDLRKQVHIDHLSKALSERISDHDVVNELVGLILATMRIGAVYDMRDLYGMSEDAIKARFKEMISALLKKYR